MSRRPTLPDNPTTKRLETKKPTLSTYKSAVRATARADPEHRLTSDLDTAACSRDMCVLGCRITGAKAYRSSQ